MRLFLRLKISNARDKKQKTCVFKASDLKENDYKELKEAGYSFTYVCDDDRVYVEIT